MPKFSTNDLNDLLGDKSEETCLKRLVEKKATVDTTIPFGDKGQGQIPLLHYFAAEGKLTQVQAIIGYFRQDNGLTIEDNTAQQKKLSFQEALDFPDTNENHKKTALHYASLYGHADVVHALLQAGAHRDVVTSSGDTPLHCAAPLDYYAVARELLSADAASTFVSCQNNDKLTALMLLIRDSKITSLHKKDCTETARFLLDYYRQHKITLDEKESETDNTLLHLAILNGYNPEIVERIVSLNPTLVNAENNNHETPVMLVIKHSPENVSVLKPLLVDAVDLRRSTDDTGSNALHYAVQHGKKIFVEQLLARDNGLVATTNDDGETPLHLAVKYEHPAIVIMLLAQIDKLDKDTKQIALNGQNNKGNTPAHLAVIARQQDIYNLLKDKDADLTITDNDGKTPTALLVEKPFPTPKAAALPVMPGSNASDASESSTSSTTDHASLLRQQAAAEQATLDDLQEKQKQRELDDALASDNLWIRSKAHWQQLPLLVKLLIITGIASLLLSSVIAICIFCPPIGHPLTLAMTHFLKALLVIPAKATWVPPYAQAFAILAPEILAAGLWGFGLVGYGAYLAYSALFSTDEETTISEELESTVEKPSFSYKDIVLNLEETKKNYVDPLYENISEYVNSLFDGFKGCLVKGSNPDKDAASYNPVSASEASLQQPAEQQLTAMV